MYSGSTRYLTNKYLLVNFRYTVSISLLEVIIIYWLWEKGSVFTRNRVEQETGRETSLVVGKQYMFWGICREMNLESVRLSSRAVPRAVNTEL